MNDWDQTEIELRLASEEIDLKIQKAEKEEETDTHFDLEKVKSLSLTQDNNATKCEKSGRLAEDQDTLDDVLQQGMNPKHTMRIQKAEIKSLANKLENMTLMKNEAEKLIKELKAKLHACQTDNQHLEREYSRSSRNKKSSTKEPSDVADLRVTNQSLMKENQSLQSILKDAELKSQTRELRLKRALQAVEKYKQLLLNRKLPDNQSDNKYEQEIQNLKQAVADSEQKNKDLLHGFRVQMQLIDVLKRQKIHLEAGKMLDFTEREFQSSINWTGE